MKRSAPLSGLGLVLAALAPPPVHAGTDPPAPPCPTHCDLRARCIDGRAVLAPAGPWSLSVDLSVGIGIFFADHGKVALSVGRRLWDRVEVETSFRLGLGQGLVMLEPSVRAAVLLYFSRRWTVAVGWRVGGTALHLEMPIQWIWTWAVSTGPLVELKYTIVPALSLRLASLVGTGYWNHIWGFIMEPGLGLAYHF